MAEKADEDQLSNTLMGPLSSADTNVAPVTSLCSSEVESMISLI